MAELLSIQQYGSPPHEQKWACRTLHPASKKYGSVSSLCSSQTDYEMNRSDSMAGIIVENNNGVIGRRPPVTVTWKNITLTTKEGKTILKSVSGQVCTGELTAIMGPSGAGKSTLLNVLSGFTKQKVEGSVLVNGLERDMHMFRKLSCYIMQDDHLLPHLTVEESLTFAANLKIAGSASRQEKQNAVSDVLHSLGLTETRNTKTSQLSGGQRKRLCIAQELVSNPPVIFLDEPTSGLDSSYCLQCIKLLKSLAEDGRTVVCTIHQPSARIFEIFDKLYMLAEGNCIYRGPARSLVSFLSEQGLKCPQYHNPTDFATEVATGEYGDWILKLTKAVQCLEDEVNEDQCLPGIKTQSVEMLTLEASTQCLMQDLVNSKQSIFKEALLASSYKGFATSSFNQFRVLLHRSILCTLREPMATKLRFAAHVVVGLLLGMLYFGIGNDASKIFNNSGFLFFSLLFLIFTAMMPTVLTFPLEKTIFVREHLNSWYSTKMYYLAKTMAEIPFQVVFPVIYCSIVYWMTNQPFEIFRFGLFLLSSFMISLLAQSIGLLIGAATSVQNAVFLAPVVSIPILLFSGFFISLNAIPPYLKWVPYLSYIRYCYESVLLSIYSLDRPELKCDKAFCPFQDPVDFLKEMDMTEAKLYIDYLAQLAFFLVFRLAAYYVLRWKLTNSR